MGIKMYKIMVGGAILIGSILIVQSIMQNSQTQVLIWFARTGTLAMVSIIIGAILGFGIKGLLDSKSYNDNDDFNY